MTHPSHSDLERTIAGRDYEVALNELIVEQKNDVSEEVSKGNLLLAKGCMIALTELEQFRLEMLTGKTEPELSENARQSIDTNVWVRMDRHRMLREGIL